MGLVVGVDSSTQSTKVELRDADSGTLVGVGSVPHPPTSPPRSEQDPSAWRDAMFHAWRTAGGQRVAAIAVAAQQHGLVALGADLEVLRPAKLWNDTESAPDAAQLVQQLGGPAIWSDTVGTVPVAALTISKLAWLRRCEPDTFEKLRHVAVPHDWLSTQLTGELVTDRGDASGTGWWSPFEERWRPDVLTLIDETVEWPRMLPPVLGPVDVAGKFDGAVVAPGTGDNMAAALGLGLRTGEVALSIGTSGTVFSVSPDPIVTRKGAVAAFADANGGFLPLVCTLNAAKVTDAFARLLGVSNERFDTLAITAPPGADGLVLLPYLDGERGPDRPQATGTLSGIRSGVTTSQFARAAVEGVVCNLLDGVEALESSELQTSGAPLLLIGGGARSAAYRRVVADLSGRPIIAVDGELVARGACVQAAAALHGCPPAQVAAAWGRPSSVLVEPDTGVDRFTIRATYASRAARTAGELAGDQLGT